MQVCRRYIESERTGVYTTTRGRACDQTGSVSDANVGGNYRLLKDCLDAAARLLALPFVLILKCLASSLQCSEDSYITFSLFFLTCSQEERLRTGEDGPAGAAYALRPSLDRFLPSPSALEQALRDSLYQIVQDEERVHHLEHRSGQFLKSTQEVLLGCSQAANTVRPEVAPQDLEPRLDTNSIGAEGWLADDERGPSREHSASDQGGQDELINENVIRSQLNLQSRASQVCKVKKVISCKVECDASGVVELNLLVLSLTICWHLS